MKAKGTFMFKNLEVREKGQFTNKQTGEVVDYGSCFIVTCDEFLENNKIKERKFHFDLDNNGLANDFRVLEPYTKVDITFDVSLYSANAKVKPIAVELC